jgi:hypothetical protein
MNGFLVLLRYDCCDVPVQMFDEHGEHAAVNLAADVAQQPYDVHERFPAVFDALEIRRPDYDLCLCAAAVLRIADGVVSELVDEFYADADDDTDDDNNGCDFD